MSGGRRSIQTLAEKRACVRERRHDNLSIQRGCELMGVARSSFYAEPVGRPADAVIVAEIRDITDEFEGYGYRRVDAELRHRGFVVNAKKVRRLMKENDLNPRRRRRFVRTNDSDHDSPISRASRKGSRFTARSSSGWPTYLTITGGFAYAALILDAWSRRVVGCAIGRGIDARLAVKALRQAIAQRRPLPGCVFHTDRGPQYASEIHRDLLEEHGFIGSM
ncbi:IS3 family transposase, partial [Psychromarinibacter halotolerans]